MNKTVQKKRMKKIIKDRKISNDPTLTAMTFYKDTQTRKLLKTIKIPKVLKAFDYPYNHYKTFRYRFDRVEIKNYVESLGRQAEEHGFPDLAPYENRYFFIERCIKSGEDLAGLFHENKVLNVEGEEPIPKDLIEAILNNDNKLLAFAGGEFPQNGGRQNACFKRMTKEEYDRELSREVNRNVENQREMAKTAATEKRLDAMTKELLDLIDFEKGMLKIKNIRLGLDIDIKSYNISENLKKQMLFCYWIKLTQIRLPETWNSYVNEKKHTDVMELKFLSGALKPCDGGQPDALSIAEVNELMEKVCRETETDVNKQEDRSFRQAIDTLKSRIEVAVGLSEQDAARNDKDERELNRVSNVIDDRQL